MEVRAEMSRIRLWLLILAFTAALPPNLAIASTENPEISPAMVRLPGHVLPALAKATVVPSKPNSSSQPITLTIVLRRDDQAGFERYLHEIYDPHSKNFHHFRTQRQIADTFGPSREDYRSVLIFLRTDGFKLVEGSRNRLTLTVRGTRAQAENAFDINFRDYRVRKRTFFANDRGPAVPARLAPRIQVIAGLSNLGLPNRAVRVSASPEQASSSGAAPNWQTTKAICLTSSPVPFIAGNLFSGILSAIGLTAARIAALATFGAYTCLFFAAGSAGYFLGCSIIAATGDQSVWTNQAASECPQFAQDFGGLGIFPKGGGATLLSRSEAVKPAAVANPQKIGLLEFDTFKPTDISNWLGLLGGDGPPANLSEFAVNGGVASPGPGESEVILDVDMLLALAELPGVSYVVYDAPPSTSFETMFNAMINDGDTVISNSWSQCEDQTTPAEASSIDSVLQTAAASGISVFNGTGDSGSTCLDGSSNTIGVPADSPNATAVGGTTPTPGPGLTYGSETWWDGTAEMPPTGQGGFGVSKFFAAPAYQGGSGMRSIPDVVVAADPSEGVQICQADDGGCPSGKLFGGTSMSAPEWAAYTADLNSMFNMNLGNANLYFYALAGTPAFHDAASMGSDFAHVGLGSPDFLQLRLALTGEKTGSVSTAQSVAVAGGNNQGGSGPADGKTLASVQVVLADANNFPVSGKTVSLTANSGSSATITPPSSVSDSDGTAVFQLTDSKVENVTLTVTDTTDSVTLTQSPVVQFVTPPAASAGLIAGPSQVTADGKTPADITVTLQDSLGRPTPGKLIQISQTGGNSVISGPIRRLPTPAAR